MSKKKTEQAWLVTALTHTENGLAENLLQMVGGN